MSTMMTTVKKWQDGYVGTVKRVEEPVVKFSGRMAEAMVRFVPERPAFMTGMPKVAEVVDSQLKFRKRMVDEQAAFARKMVKAWHPVLAKFESTPVHAPAPRPVAVKPMTVKPATRRSPKRAVRKVA